MSSASSIQSKILFVSEPRADVVLVSSDGLRFLVRKVSLQANSDFFDGMFATLDGQTSETDEETGLPAIKLDDKGSDIDALLCCCVLKQPRSDLADMPFDVAAR